MSSKLWWAVLFVAVACGVKGPPVPPSDAVLPSIEEEHKDLHLKPGTITPIKAP